MTFSVSLPHTVPSVNSLLSIVLVVKCLVSSVIGLVSSVKFLVSSV